MSDPVGEEPTVQRLNAADALLIGVAASYWPLGVMASNLVGTVHPERLIGLIVAVWAIGLLAVWILGRRESRRRPVAHIVFIGLVLVMSGGGGFSWQSRD